MQFPEVSEYVQEFCQSLFIAWIPTVWSQWYSSLCFLICSIPQTVLLSKIFFSFLQYQRFLYASWMSYLSDHCNKIRTVFTKLPGNVCCILLLSAIFCFAVRQKPTGITMNICIPFFSARRLIFNGKGRFIFRETVLSQEASHRRTFYFYSLCQPPDACKAFFSDKHTKDFADRKQHGRHLS